LTQTAVEFVELLLILGNLTEVGVHVEIEFWVEGSSSNQGHHTD
jgi:hypothetical protein